MPTILDGVITVTVAAAEHECSDTTIRRAIARGEIRAQRIGKHLFVRRIDVTRWAETRKGALR